MFLLKNSSAFTSKSLFSICVTDASTIKITAMQINITYQYFLDNCFTLFDSLIAD